MKKQFFVAIKETVILFVFYLCYSSIPVYAYTYFEDGGTHKIDYQVNSNDTYGQYDVLVDNSVQPNPGTHIDVVTGGKISEIRLSGKSSVDLDGGKINRIFLKDNTSAFIENNIDDTYVTLWGYSKATISGGLIWIVETVQFNSVLIKDHPSLVYVHAFGDSKIDIYGGKAAPYRNVYLDVRERSKIVLYGTFNTYGTIKSDKHLSGKIGGILASGDIINWNYDVYPGGSLELVSIPEPCTLLLLGLGGMLIRKR